MSKYINTDEYKNILHKEIDKMYEFRSAEEIEQNPFEEEKVKAKKEAFYCAITKAMEMPSVEIVRCQDCKYMRTLYHWIHGQAIDTYYCKRFCDSDIGKIDLNDYCSKGERKETDDRPHKTND